MTRHTYPRYARYKESGVEWFPEIPEHWCVRKLKTIADVRTSNVDKKTEDGEPFVRLCNYVDVYRNERITPHLRFMEATASRAQIERFTLRYDDVLITKDSETPDDIAVPAWVSADMPGVVCGYHLALVRPRDGSVQGRYLSRAFAAIGPRDQFHTTALGITRFGLAGDAITSAVFPIPPLREQRAIAAFLDRETARIDALIEKQERLLEKLEEKRKAVIAQAVTRGLNSNVPLKESGVAWLGKIPEHWDVSRLTYLYRERDERAEPNLPLLNVSISSGVTVREFSDSRIETMAADFNIYKVARKGDIAFNKMRMWQGAVGVAPVDGLVSPDYTVAHDIGNTVVEYYDALFHTERFFVEVIGRSHGIVWDRLRLYWDGFKDIRVPVPPQPEQAAIVASLRALKSRTDESVVKVRQLVTKLRERRTALISAAVTGKIAVGGHHQ